MNFYKSCNIFSFVFLMMSCDSGMRPYFKHSLEKYEKLNESCINIDSKFRMVSNIVGERYTFQKCLPASYDGEYIAERKGDSVIVAFQKTDGPAVLFNITLDINTYPRYNYLTIDGDTFTIIPAGN